MKYTYIAKWKDKSGFDFIWEVVQEHTSNNYECVRMYIRTYIRVHNLGLVVRTYIHTTSFFFVKIISESLQMSKIGAGK